MATGILIKSILGIILIVTILVTGMSLHKKEKPYNKGLLTVHKLATIVLVVLAAIFVVAYLKEYEANLLLLIIIVILAISIIGLLVSGGSMSLDKNDKIMLLIHRVSTAGFMVSIAAFVYILIHSNN